MLDVNSGTPLSAAPLLQLQRSAGNAAVSAFVEHRRAVVDGGTTPQASSASLPTLQRVPASAALRAARALGKRLLRSSGVRGSQMLYRAASRRAVARLQKFGIDRAVAVHIAEHFVVIPEKVAHSVFEKSLRNTKAITSLVTETLKKGAAAPILSVTDSGALAWVFEAELGRIVGRAGKQALTKLRVVVDLEGRLITAFPIKSVLRTITMNSLRGIRVTLSAALSVVAVQGIYEGEALAAMEARKAFDERNEPSLWEYLLPWGPSSTIGYEPNFARVRERAAAAADKIEEALGMPLDARARVEVENDVLSLWH
jgi:hypothetical protein